MHQYIVKRPLITEKATQLGGEGKYMFLVDSKSTKPEIKKAVQAAYKVTVNTVNVLNVKSKERRLGATVGTKSGYKKAIVTLRKGQTLDILPHS